MGVCSNNCSQIKSSKVPNNNIKPKENKNINIAKEQEDINTIVNKENIKAFRFYNKTKDINIPLIVDSDSQIILQIYKHKEYLKKWIALCTKKEEVSVRKFSRSNVKPKLDNLSVENYKPNDPFYSKLFHSLQNSFKNDNFEFVKFLSKGPPNKLRWLIYMSIAINQHQIYSEKEYKESLNKKLDPEIDIQIKKDLNRSAPDIKYFQTPNGTNSLYNILKAMALFDPELGYCQGMNIIAARILLISDGNEVETFFILRYLFAVNSGLMLREFYLDGFPRVGLYIFMVREIIKVKMPKIHEKIEELMLPDELWLFKWFQSLFNLTLQFTISIRLLDCIFAFGLEFMLNFSIAIIMFNEFKLLKANDIDEFLTSFMFHFDTMSALLDFREKLIKTAKQVTIDDHLLEKLQKDYEKLHPKKDHDKWSEGSEEYFDAEHEMININNKIRMCTKVDEESDKSDKEIESNKSNINQVQNGDKDLERLEQEFRETEYYPINKEINNEVYWKESIVLKTSLKSKKNPLSKRSGHTEKSEKTKKTEKTEKKTEKSD